MAKNKFDLDFDDFEQLAYDVASLGDEPLKRATEEAMRRGKDEANKRIKQAMESSTYAFTGDKYSRKRAIESLNKVAKMPVEWEGTTCIAYVGVDLKEAPEALILALGTPTLYKDNKLNNAIKVKGKNRKAVDSEQISAFNKVLKEEGNL